MTSTNYDPLFHWVRAREAARIRKEVDRADPPYTDDPIIAAYRFCNVRREDDRGTIWIRKNIREPFAEHRYLWLMLCIARQINWPDTLEELIHERAWPDAQDFNPALITQVLDARKDRGDKVYTGAYMISAPATKGASKQAYIAETVIGALWGRRDALKAYHFKRLESMHEWISRSNGWGPFMAYQAVVDMRFTVLMDRAEDISLWAAAGPGTIRGLNRLYWRPVDKSLSQGQALGEMRALYRVVQAETGVAMDFSDVPNCLCETDKYLRVLDGEGKPRALYVPGRGS